MKIAIHRRLFVVQGPAYIILSDKHAKYKSYPDKKQRQLVLVEGVTGTRIKIVGSTDSITRYYNMDFTDSAKKWGVWPSVTV